MEWGYTSAIHFGSRPWMKVMWLGCGVRMNVTWMSYVDITGGKATVGLSDKNNLLNINIFYNLLAITKHSVDITCNLNLFGNGNISNEMTNEHPG